VQRAIPDLKKIDVAGECRGLCGPLGSLGSNGSLGNNEAAELGLDCGNVLLGGPNRHLDGDCRRVVREHEALKLRMALKIGADGWQNEGGHFRRGVLLFHHHEPVEGEKIGRELGVAGAILAADRSWGQVVGMVSRKSATFANLVSPMRLSSSVPSRVNASLGPR
jgi:hypothetical protein